MSVTFRLAGGLLPLLTVILAAQGAWGQAPVAPASPQASKTDPWAGKTVKDASHVQGMMEARLGNAPRIGEPAPPLSLADAFTGKVRSLVEMRRDRPVVLFFGSSSCGVTRRSAVDVAKLAERFGNRLDFYMVYIREAHPTGGFHTNAESRYFSIHDPETFAERAAAAVSFKKQTGLAMPVLVDSMDDAAAVRWAGWPVRLFLIDRSGKVAFAGQQGPWFHKPSRTYDPKISASPEAIRDLPGYSRESLEEFLETRFPAGK